MPATAVTVVVPDTPVAVDVMATEAVEVVTRFPSESCTCTVPPKFAPAVTRLGGGVVKTSLEAVPATTTTLPLVELVSPPEAAVSV